MGRVMESEVKLLTETKIEEVEDKLILPMIANVGVLEVRGKRLRSFVEPGLGPLAVEKVSP